MAHSIPQSLRPSAKAPSIGRRSTPSPAQGTLCKSLLRGALILGALWMLCLLWLHAMQAELHVEGQAASQLIDALGAKGKLTHLRQFAREIMREAHLPIPLVLQEESEELSHIDAYDPASKHDDDDDSLDAVKGRGGAAATATAHVEAAGPPGGGDDADDDADDSVSRSVIGQPHPRAQTEAREPPLSSSPNDALHIVFSTDCSFYQDWQSLVLFHSAHAAGQLGHITRIASGCDDRAQFDLLALYARLWPLTRTGGWTYGVHFTPDFKRDAGTGKSYDFYNKPYGVQHWLRSLPAAGGGGEAGAGAGAGGGGGRGEGGRPPLLDENTIVALVDPDFLFLRPLTVDINQQATTDPRPQRPTVVARGAPSGQLYGLGAPWANKRNQDPSLRTPKGANNFFDLPRICGEGSPCLAVSQRDGELFYAVGPPYMAHVDDLRRLVDTWVLFVPKVYRGYPHLLAEMYAYVLAAAHEQLPHSTVWGHMVSNVQVPASGEGWAGIDSLGDAVCLPAVPQPQMQPQLTSAGEAGEAGARKLFHPQSALPTVLHYCQFYRIGRWGFQKRRLHKSVFQCASPLLADLPHDVGSLRFKDRDGEIVQLSAAEARRNAFMLCTIHNAINDAVLDVKERSCRGGGGGGEPGAGEGADGADEVNANRTLNLALDWKRKR